jgi:hypothetical protein
VRGIDAHRAVAARVAAAHAPEVEPRRIVSCSARFEAATARGTGHRSNLSVSDSVLHAGLRVHLERHGVPSDGLIRVVVESVGVELAGIDRGSVPVRLRSG